VLGVPVEPPPSRWELPAPEHVPDGAEIAGVGADLAPGTLLAAYRQGLFPMRLQARGPLGLGPLGWWSPDPRGILPLDGLHVSRSLRRSQRRFEIRVDTAFEDVMRGCADPKRPHGWIDKKFIAAYTELYRLGWAHSVETWQVGDRGGGDRGRDELVGGLYGVAIGGLFAAESKFHRVTDASKVAVVALVDLMRAGGGTLLDVQWTTPHLASLGAVDVPRTCYLELVADAVAAPTMSTFPDRTGR
jgi:leucyl/phenylalanyl-tRNA--protein transferase